MLEGFKLEALTARHLRDRFTCKSAGLNDFIHKRARKQHENGTTRVHVYADAAGTIAGFFTLSAHLVELTGLPPELLKGRPRLPIPATLLGRFAVDESYEGKGLGSMLLSFALRAAHKSAQTVASAFVALEVGTDASPNAAKLYAKFGFEPLESNPKKMLLKIETIGHTLKP